MLSALLRQTGSPNFKVDLPVSANQLEIFPIGGDQTSAVRARSKGDENVEMQVTEFGRREAVIGTNARQNFP